MSVCFAYLVTCLSILAPPDLVEPAPLLLAPVVAQPAPEPPEPLAGPIRPEVLDPADRSLVVLAASLAEEPEPEPEPEPAATEGGSEHDRPGDSRPPEGTGQVPEPWHSLAVCESGMGGEPRWHVDTGNGFLGGLQFEQRSWDWAIEATGIEAPATPLNATPMEQVRVAEALLSIHPAGWGAWPACADQLGLR